MESSAKRRKVDNGSLGLRHDALIDFESRDTTRVSTASPFILKTDELLKQTSIDYKTRFKGADELLHNIKGIIDTIEPHEPLLVCIICLNRQGSY